MIRFLLYVEAIRWLLYTYPPLHNNCQQDLKRMNPLLNLSDRFHPLNPQHFTLDGKRYHYLKGKRFRFSFESGGCKLLQYVSSVRKHSILPYQPERENRFLNLLSKSADKDMELEFPKIIHV